ncbi:hypothetical protein HMI54_006776 [Coelomomyces lativittatus]|nr:hypothetical protein HMI55_003234 [Coelomomyces lativittatus]KAJ1504618.1 hypothetical protein HMI54_006776 [Coelomomyces lativittatus]KAJ1512326.1 hypothetical protein HMI56_004208 [Coelomomyces lativittatus]
MPPKKQIRKSSLPALPFVHSLPHLLPRYIAPYPNLNTTPSTQLSLENKPISQPLNPSNATAPCTQPRKFPMDACNLIPSPPIRTSCQK